MDRPQDDSDHRIQKLLKWVESTENRGMRSSDDVNLGYDWDVPYVSQAALVKYFSEYHSVEKLLRALFGDDRSKDSPTARRIKEDYCKIFSLLISIGKGQFITHFVRHEIDDQRLPLQTQPLNFPSSPSDPQFFSAFYQKQWQFCAPRLHADIFDRHFEVKEYILPIRRIGELGHGGSATAFKVEVPDCYNSFIKDTSDQNEITGNNGDRPTVKTYVLKSYHATSTAEQHYENEWTAYKRVHSNQPCPNIVGIYSGFRLGGRNNLLLEYADQGTLEEYLEKTSPPSSAEDIIDLWESVLRVLIGLVTIHNPPSSDTADQGWHQDIKPTNILVKSRPEGSVYKFDCKLADLGLSHFKRSLPFEDGGADITDTDAFGTRAYGAPECFRLGAAIERKSINVKQSVDIWSLGCVFSEVATWVVCNWKNVIEYRNQRRDETERNGRFISGDYCFHDGQDGLLKCVDYNHDELVDPHLEAHDYITKHVLKLVKDHMLTPSYNNGRQSAKWLYTEAEFKLKMVKRDVLPSGSKVWHPPFHTPEPVPIPGPLNFDPPPQPARPTTQHSPPLTQAPEPLSGYIHDNSPGANIKNPLTQNTSDGYFGTAIHSTANEDQISQQLRNHDQSPNENQLQHHYSPPVWPVEEALHWRRVEKDRNNNEVVHIPNENRLDDVKDRDHVFLIDNASSMITYWPEARRLLDLLGRLVKTYDKNHVDIRFTTPFTTFLNVKNTEKLTKIFDEHSPNSGLDVSDMSASLWKTVSEYQEKLTKKQRKLPFVRSTRPLSLYVFTDAVWQPVCDVAPVIKSLVNTLEQQNLHKQQIGIQFIQFGNKLEYTQRLRDLDRLRLNKHVDTDIVDTEPSTGSVWKMLFGAINEWFDGDVPGSSSMPTPPTSPTSPMIPTPGSRDRYSIARQGSGSQYSHATQHSLG